MALPSIYEEKVYAGVLGKIICLYLGRAFEGWENRKVLADLGSINYYVHTIDERPIQWWAGLGNSTEHTAFLRLKNGVPAPESGGIALKSKVVAEQIGAQTFIDGFLIVLEMASMLLASCAPAATSDDGYPISG